MLNRYRQVLLLTVHVRSKNTLATCVRYIVHIIDESFLAAIVRWKCVMIRQRYKINVDNRQSETVTLKICGLSRLGSSSAFEITQTRAESRD